MALFFDWDWLVIVTVLLGYVYIKSRIRYTYWEKKGVRGPKPSFLFGNSKDLLLLRKSTGTFYSDQYFKSKSLPYIGVYSLRGPTFVINDLDLIQTVLTKDFVHFSDHGLPIDEKKEPLTMHLFNATGEKWKNLRVKLTPTFTTSKMRFMFDTIAQCNLEMIHYLESVIDEDNKMEVKELFAKLNTDVIGSCAFGIECNSFKEPDAEFRMWGKKLFSFNAGKLILRLLMMMLPKYLRIFNVGSFTGKEITDFFYKTVDKTIKYREENNITRNDVLQLLMELKDKGYVEDETTKTDMPDDGVRLTTMQIAAQVFVFFVAGFETSSTTSSFALYELAVNPDVQQTLREEVDRTLDKYGGKATYDALGEMTYLTKVIEETLRKYPPLPVMLRICTKDYTIPGTRTVIDKGTMVIIPVLGIHCDPDIYPDPLKFDPERFSPEARATRHHYSYLPFGEGPRICIGLRFGMIQVKLGLVSLLSKYEVSVCEKTQIPMKFEKKAFISTAEGGVWLKFSRRSK